MIDKKPAKLIAFYLPQYHPVPENDAWWGKGFTDWDNVRKAKPLFQGHDQPRVPSELGYYDPRMPEVREAQARLAAEYGIYGFCYHHYWFQGKRVLNQPLDEMLASGKPDFPFCLNWANENWTRTWDGRDQDVLMAQKYSEEDDRRHIEWLIPVLKDRRYIRIGGKPLLLIYAPQRMPDPRKTLTLWREEAIKSGLPGLYLCKVETFSDQTAPGVWGFDAAVQFPPHGVENKGCIQKGKLWDLLRALGLSEKAYGAHTVLDYQAVAKTLASVKDPDYPFFHGIFPGWDNTPRRESRGWILKNASPEAYGNWLKALLGKQSEAENLIFINAWNEWAEGAYLEPDQKCGRAYLEATRRALEEARG